MIHRNNKDTSEQSITQVNNANPTNTKSTLHNKILFKDAVEFLPHTSFSILSHQIAPKSTSNGSNTSGQKGTSNCNLKRCLIIPSIAKNNNNSIAVGKAVNVLMKVIHGI